MEVVEAYTIPFDVGIVEQDLDNNANSKTIIVPSNQIWIVESIMITYNCSSAVGDRAVNIQISHATSDPQTDLNVTLPTLTASQRARITLSKYIPTDVTDPTYAFIHLSMPILPPLARITIQDSNDLSELDDIWITIIGQRIYRG